MGPENFPPLLSIVKGVFEGLVEMMLDGTEKANELPTLATNDSSSTRPRAPEYSASVLAAASAISSREDPNLGKLATK